MGKYKAKCMEYMRSEKIRFEDLREHVIKVTFKGEHLTSIPIYVYFDEGEHPIVTVKCWDIINYENHMELAMRVCNDLNAQYQWVKFYVDKDADIVAEIDAYVEEQNCGANVATLIRRLVRMVDDAHPTLVSELWG